MLNFAVEGGGVLVKKDVQGTLQSIVSGNPRSEMTETTDKVHS
jgi:hypothetical protein